MRLRSIHHGAAKPALDHARRLYELRRWRDAIAPGDYFGEPAWDMLLELWIAQDERRDISSAMLGASVLAGHLRLFHLNRLIAGGLIETTGAGTPAALCRLTETGVQFMRKVLWPLSSRPRLVAQVAGLVGRLRPKHRSPLAAAIGMDA